VPLGQGLPHPPHGPLQGLVMERKRGTKIYLFIHHSRAYQETL
jgi:hypothetical protein